MQRFFDVIFSLIAVILLLPLLFPIALVLRITGEGEVFFQQSRIGKNGRPFNLIKFATMLKNSPNIGTGTITLREDPRILPVGRLLRSTKLNELPQLFNVLRGDMSLIGPRPQTYRCFKAFPLRSQKEIIKVRPGLSGIGSIFFRDEDKIMQKSEDPTWFYDQVIMRFKGLLECWYVENQSLRLYFRLIFLTVLVVLFRSINVRKFLPKTLPSAPAELKAE